MTDLVKEHTTVVEGAEYSPRRVATDLMATIKDIEEAIEDSGEAIKEVEGRGFLKRTFSSSSKDLVTISGSQNKINDLMLGLIQEIITLNAMSYSYLAAVQAEFQKSVKEGWIDSEGRFQELSESGEAFATTASDIFGKIIEGSRSTRDKIELNSTRIEDIHQFLEKKITLDEQQSQDIASLKSALHEKSSIIEQQSQQVKSLAEALQSKKALITEQSQQLQEMRRLLEEQESVDGQHAQKLIELVDDLQQKEAQGASRDSAILGLNELVEGLVQRIDNLQKRSQTLVVVSAMLGVCTVGLMIGLGLVVFGVA